MRAVVQESSDSPLFCSAASSRLTDARAAGREAAEQALARVRNPQLVLVFAACTHDQAEVLMGVRAVTRDLPVAGGASFAELTPQGYRTGSVVVAVLGCAVHAALAGEPYAGDPRTAAVNAARAASRELGARPDVALVFLTGENGEATIVVDALKKTLGENVLVFGGGTAYRETGGMTITAPSRQFFHDRVITSGVVLVLLKLTGASSRLVTAVSHGLQPISQPVVCSAADGNWVQEIDGEDVYAFYEKYLGRKVEDVGPYIYTYPMLVNVPGQEQPLVRLPYTVDRARGGIEFFPEGLAPGQTATLAHFSRGEIVRACRESAYEAREALGAFRPRMVLAVSCNARQMFLGPRVASETRILQEVFGPEVPVAGFYSGVEIAPHCRRVSTGEVDCTQGAAQVVAQTFCVLAIGDTGETAHPVEVPLELSRPAPLSVDETLRQAHDEIRRLRQQIRENEELLDVRERVLMRINRENIDVSRELRQVNAKLSELVADHILGREVGGYVIESFVGAGGGGNVYRARHGQSGRRVALKMLPKTMTAMQEKRFRREMNALAKIADRHVVPYIESELARPLPFLAMGLVEGPTLEHEIQEAAQRGTDGDRAFPLDATLRWSLGIARGLAAAHARKVLHRDLKPGNVIIDAEGEAVLIDFGLARETGAANTSTVTVEGEVLGTVPYFSPEHFRGHPTQASSDVYQWGLLVHEMLTGTLPYPELEGWPQLLERFEKGVRFTAPSPALARLASLAERCLDPVARRRPASASEIVSELSN